jgi:hypothetical protein
MLTRGEFLALFDTSTWETIEPFYQDRYGWSKVKPGWPPSDAEIQILKVVRK